MNNIHRRFIFLRWRGYCLLAVAFMLVFFHRMAPGVVAPDLMAAFDISAGALGSLSAMYFYIYTALQIPSGVMADTVGPRYTVSISGLVAAGGAVLFGLAPDFFTANVGRFLVGAGSAFVFVGLMKYNTLWFPERRYALIAGLTMLLGNLGAITAATPLAWALNFSDWRSVFVGLGLLGGIASIAIFLFVRNKPQDAGLPGIRELAGEPPHPEPEHHWARELLAVFRNRRIWPGFAAMFGTTGAGVAFAGLWAVPMLQDVHGLARQAAANYATVTLLGLAVGFLVSGGISDALGRRRPVAAVFAAGTFGGWLALLLLPWGPGWSGYLLFTLIGFSAGGVAVVYAAIKEVAQPLYAGMAIALVNTGLFLGAAIAQPLFGWVMDLTWDGEVVAGISRYDWTDYRNGLWLYAGFGALGVLGAFGLTETHARNIQARVPTPAKANLPTTGLSIDGR